ncbi:hypothetical protein Vadar_004117 [Vaccinium darrowii]|uniref:Uncharacterized protein n=1 Tax=Vaccinium darrowii TaxID=229202 RepID=A0ACB7XNV0_9ERIC|nr:hypothetical protein Vadar_004117 [Vaccinium darrowii]
MCDGEQTLEQQIQTLKQQIQKDLDSPMPWIGMYVAAASLLCSVAMAGDVIHGIRRKKLWFPCKYFTMNAASLTALAVAMKLPMDLTTVMWGTTDTLAKLSGIVFMITVMGNFLTSFAVMNDNESLMNIMALGILVITIIVNIGIVVASKLVHLTSIIITLPLFSCFYFCKTIKVDQVSESNASTNNRSSEPENSSPELNLYVLRLEGEELPKIILKNICHELNQVIQKGKSQQPKNLKELLRKSNNNLKGVVDFDSTSHVPNCWTMPVVNLTSIAIALPNIESHSVDHLICSVSEGLLHASLVDECFSSKGDNMINLKCVADVVWEGIELNLMWLDRDLQKLRLEGKTIEGTLQTLVDIAEKAAIEFERSVTGGSKVLAANSMYRISQTILKDYEGNMDAHTDGNLFEKLSIMIADILGACLLNLPHVIIQKCYRSSIEEREKSVSHATCLLGETEEILAILEHKQLPCLSGDRAAYIDEWRFYMMQKDPPTIVPSSSNEIHEASAFGELHINVTK